MANEETSRRPAAEPKTVLCFGDSLTWGFDPRGGERFVRYGFAARWTRRLQAELGSPGSREGSRATPPALPATFLLWQRRLRPWDSLLASLAPLTWTGRIVAHARVSVHGARRRDRPGLKTRRPRPT